MAAFHRTLLANLSPDCHIPLIRTIRPGQPDEKASVSVASNIAEGYGRATRGEYVQFLGHARGSTCELQTQLFIAEQLGLGPNHDQQQVEQLAADVSRMLNALMRKLKG